MTPEEQNEMNSELFERLRKLETSVALLAKDVKAQKDAFDIHDKREMDKFSQVEDSIKKFDIYFEEEMSNTDYTCIGESNTDGVLEARAEARALIRGLEG